MPLDGALAYPEGGIMLTRDLGEPWLVLVTKPGMGETALMRLGGQGFEAYMPFRAPTRAERLRGVERRPMFPGYLFARPGYDGQWHGMLSTVGVSRMLMIGDRPALLSDRIVQELYEREVGGLIYLPDALEPGAMVRAELPAGHVVDAIIQANDGDRIAILMQILGREVRVTLAADKVRPMAAE